MIEMYVCRGGSVYDPPQCRQDDPALNWGSPISDPLLCTNDAAAERGRVEIDTTFTNRTITTINTPLQNFIQPGSIIEIENKSNSVIGMLTSITIEGSRSENSIDAQTTIEVESNV